MEKVKAYLKDQFSLEVNEPGRFLASSGAFDKNNVHSVLARNALEELDVARTAFDEPFSQAIEAPLIVEIKSYVDLGKPL